MVLKQHVLKSGTKLCYFNTSFIKHWFKRKGERERNDSHNGNYEADHNINATKECLSVVNN